MKPKTIEGMQYFVGKVCSVISTSMNRAFDEKLSREHFVVRVAEIVPDGIWGYHPYNNDLLSFFSMNHMISIHVEEELDPSNPEHMQMLQEFEKATGERPTGDLSGSPDKKSLLPVVDQDIDAYKKDGGSLFVDIDALNRIAQQTKRAFNIEDEFDSES